MKIKGILGSCEATIGSRFHGLVSALSQNVPTIAIGWSHKYNMLFRDYDFSEGLMNILADDEEINQKLKLLIDPNSRNQIKSILPLRNHICLKYEQMRCGKKL